MAFAKRTYNYMLCKCWLASCCGCALASLLILLTVALKDRKNFILWQDKESSLNIFCSVVASKAKAEFFKGVLWQNCISAEKMN